MLANLNPMVNLASRNLEIVTVITNSVLVLVQVKEESSQMAAVAGSDFQLFQLENQA